MKLQEFCARFGELSDEAFLANFKLPFLLEEGRLSLEEGDPSDRSVFQVRTTAEPTKIGRSKSADMRIVHEQISNRHAVIWPPASGDPRWWLMDMNSTNGTFLDGEKVPAGTRVPLKAGATVRFGQEVRLLFLSPDELLKVIRKQGQGPQALPPREDWDPLSSTTDHQIPRVFEEPTRTPTPPPAEAQSTRMVLVCEPFDPVPLELGRPVVVGRSPKTAQLVLPNSQVSREQCEVLRKPEGVFVRDLGSANGTFVCGVRVGSQPMELLPGKPITIGPFKVLLEVPGVSGSDLGATREVSASQLRKPEIEGRLEDVSLEELLHDIEGAQRSGVLTIHSAGLEGRIAFKSGAPWNAAFSNGDTDVPAIHRMLKLRAGRFALRADEGGLGERTIKLDLGEILLDQFLQEGD